MKEDVCVVTLLDAQVPGVRGTIVLSGPHASAWHDTGRFSRDAFIAMSSLVGLLEICLVERTDPKLG
jgi:hypothetical protein